MIKKYLVMTFILGCVLITPPIQAQTRLVETAPNGVIDWQIGAIVVSSDQKISVAQKIKTLLTTLRVDTTQTIGSMAQADSALIEELMSVVGNVSANNGVKIPLYGPHGVASVIFAKIVNPEWRPYAYTEEENQKEAPTGIIIDASNTEFYPSLSPVFSDELGGIFFTFNTISPVRLEKQGAVMYSDDLEKAKQAMSVADRPAVVKAIRAQGAFKGDLVFDIVSADLLRQFEKKWGMLANSRIIIVVKK